MTLKALIRGCWFSHARVPARNAKSEPVLRCVDCGDEMGMLHTAIVQGPAATPDRVHGEPLTQTFGGKVDEFRRRA